jgi:hypothetical protein
MLKRGMVPCEKRWTLRMHRLLVNTQVVHNILTETDNTVSSSRFKK